MLQISLTRFLFVTVFFVGGLASARGLAQNNSGSGSVSITGERQVWHDVQVTLDGTFAEEASATANPFLDFRFSGQFTHADGTVLQIPGYFAADGDAANTSATSGTKWRLHFSPDRVGPWQYRLLLVSGDQVAIAVDEEVNAAKVEFEQNGEILIEPSNKSGRDLRGEGRLEYVGQHYLKFAGSGRYFLKCGADAPETLLAFEDFDNTVANSPRKCRLKKYLAHVSDWRDGDPVWQNGKGKGLIGAINYLSGTGCNAFSFLTYNAGGDGDNVWPYADRDDKKRFDCSKLDQWNIVFDHATQRGMYLHFKLQETENDDNRIGNGTQPVPTSLDGGELGVERKLYLRELIARFGHHLALNWNLGEENTQTTAQQIAMIDFIAANDPYHHLIVVHTFPNQQDTVYRPLLKQKSKLMGASLQNSSIFDVHSQTAKWVRLSTEAKQPWVVAFDEAGTAAHGVCPDLGYRGFDGTDKTGKKIYTPEEVRKSVLWGNLMAGGAGVEYYFGYRFEENDLLCEDWRSRDQSWKYGAIAINFFREHKIPFWEMQNANGLIGNEKMKNDRYCFAKANEVYLVYLSRSGATEIDLSNASGGFDLHWFNPRTGGDLIDAGQTLTGGATVELKTPAGTNGEDWLGLIRRK